jgi:hypothetical protein
MDGLHITIGNVNAYKPSVAIMISVNKIKWDLKPEDIFDEGMPADPEDHPEWWHRYVEKTGIATQINGVQTGGKHVPPQQALTTGANPQNKGGSTGGTKKQKQKNHQTLKIEEIATISECYDEMMAYHIWDGLSDAELNTLKNDLMTRWADLNSDLAAIGIWAEASAIPIWKMVKNFDLKKAREEAATLVGYAEVKSTDDRDWVQESPARGSEDRDDIIALLGAE